MVKKDREDTKNLEIVFQEAVALHQNNELIEASERYQKILSIMPDSPLVNYNHGLALFELGRFAESYSCYSEALKQAPLDHDLLYNFALCAKKLGKFVEAVDAYATILEQQPDDKDSLYNLACCLMDSGADAKAIPLFLKVLDIDCNHPAALNNLACTYHRNGDYDHAKKYYTRLLQIQPSHKIARHLLASLQGDSTQNAPDQYIEQIFDNYSLRYEKNMVEDLEYTVPLKLRKAFDQVYNSSKHSLNTLDLGCGTGLAGEAFFNICSSLVGVDLSSNMIDQAFKKNIYTSLYVEEILKYLDSCDNVFDLIIAADVLIYFGDLQPILAKLWKIAQPGTDLCFSSEKSTRNNFLLRRSGRFAHGIDYIKEVCAKTGWDIKLAEPAKLRKERFEWIEGMIYIASRTS